MNSSFYARGPNRLNLRTAPRDIKRLAEAGMHGFVYSDFGTDLLGNPTQADVDQYIANMGPQIPYLEERFDTVQAQWQQDDSTAASAFAQDLDGLKTRWANAVDFCQHSNAPETKMYVLTHAITRNGDGGAWTAGDFSDLNDRLIKEEAALKVTPPPGPAVVRPQPGTDDRILQGTNGIANAVPTLPQFADSMSYWVKLLVVGVLAGLGVQVVGEMRDLRRSLQRGGRRE